MKFFSTESGFYKFMTRLWDVLKLNFLWLVCSLPIITIGASTIAAYTITLKMTEDKEGYVAKPFFKAFKANFKQGVVMSVITVICTYALYLDFQFADQVMFFVIGIFSAFLFFVTLVYTYPLLARYDNSILKTMRNSIRISLRYFGRTFGLAVIIAIEVIVFMLTKATMAIGILVGPVCIMLTVSGFSMYFFRQIEKEDGSVIVHKTEEDLYNEEIERETEEALKKENIK